MFYTTLDCIKQGKYINYNRMLLMKGDDIVYHLPFSKYIIKDMYYTIQYNNEINDFHCSLLSTDFVNDLRISGLRAEDFFKCIKLMD